MLTGARTTHIKLIASYWARFSLRTGGGLMALLIVLFVGLFLASFIVKPVELIMSKSGELGHTEGDAAAQMDKISRSKEFSDIVQSTLGAEQEQVEYLLQDQPALLSVLWVVLLIALPFMACFVGFNQTAGDIGNRGLRYLLLRTSRASIFLGRFLGAVLFSAVATGMMVTILLVYVGVKFNIYPLGDLLGWGLQGYVALVLISVPYIALCAWISSMLDSAFGALALTLTLTGGSMLALKIANGLTPSMDFAWFDRLLPWGWKYELLSGDVGTRLLAYLVMIGFTGAFLLLGLRSFTKRDL